MFEVKQDHIIRRGRITSEWSDLEQRLVTAYGNQDFHRAITTTAIGSDSPAVYANGRISFEVVLAPGAAWHSWPDL